ncbi:MAG: hypothetical protein LBR54_01155 [Oscillospiraceae bacterium]|nr:hypothetical protein [Oscillospiraceae bacterium]
MGHCAYVNGIAFISVRCISDDADDDGETSFDLFLKKAAKRVAGIVLKLTQAIE